MRRVTTKTEQDPEIGNRVMSDLGDFAKQYSPRDTKAGKRTEETEEQLPSLRERIRFARHESANAHEELATGTSYAAPIHPNIPKRASKANVPDPAYDDESLLARPIGDNVMRYRRAMKSPLVDSAIHAVLAGGLMYGASKFFDPDTDEAVAADAVELARDAKASGLELNPDTNYWLNEARRRRSSSRWKWTAAAALAAAAANELYHYEPGKPSSLFKYSSANLRKRASMLGPETTMDIDQVRAAVMDSPMTDGNKFLSMQMLDTIDKPLVSSTDIIGAAVNTGVSALGGAPIGRYTVAAAADAALGYGVGSLMGLSAPARLAAATGVTSFLARTLVPANNTN